MGSAGAHARGVGSKTFLRLAVSLWAGALLAATPPTGSPVPAAPRPVDGVRIIEVLPSRLVVGEEQDVYVRVRYELRSLEQANLSLSFNTHDSARYRQYAREVVATGAGEVVLSARIVPRDWGEFVFFQAAVSLGEIVPPPPRPPAGTPPEKRAGRPALAFDHAPIPLSRKS